MLLLLSICAHLSDASLIYYPPRRQYAEGQRIDKELRQMLPRFGGVKKTAEHALRRRM